MSLKIRNLSFNGNDLCEEMFFALILNIFIILFLTLQPCVDDVIGHIWPDYNICAQAFGPVKFGHRHN